MEKAKSSLAHNCKNRVYKGVGIGLLLYFISICCGSLSYAQARIGHWERVSLPTKNNFAQIYFSDSLHVLLSMQSTSNIYRSSDAGDTWVVLKFDTVLPATQGQVLDGYFFSMPSPNVIYLSLAPPADADRYLIRSIDTGKTWRIVGDGIIRNVSYSTFVTPSFGFRLIGSTGYLTLVKDFGELLQSAMTDSVLEARLTVPAGIYNQIGWSDTMHFAISLPSFSGLDYIYTTDQGYTWQRPQETPAGYEHYGLWGNITFLKGTSYVWMNPINKHFAPTGFLTSSDYGATWQDHKIFIARIACIAPVDTTSIWFAHSMKDKLHRSRGANADHITFTPDNGKTLYTDSTTFAGWDINTIEFTDKHHGWITAQRGSEHAVFRYTE